MIGALERQLWGEECSSRPQGAGLDQLVHHGRVGGAEFAGLLALGLQHLEAGEQGNVIVVGSVGVDGVRHLMMAVGLPDLEIVRAVAGGRVDEAGAGVVGDVVAGEQGHGEAIAGRERRQRVGALEAGRIEVVDAGPAGDFRSAEDVFGQFVGNDQPVAGPGPGLELQPGLHGRDLIEAIGDLGTVADGPVGRDGPGRGGPDDHRRIGMAEGQQVVGMRIGRAGDREFDPDRRADVVVVFDLGVSQGGALDRRPHDRLGAAIELARVLELVEFRDDGGFGAEIHGGVAIVPVAEDAQPFELLALHIDPAGRVFAAGLTELGLGDLVLALALRAVAFLDLPLDRQAVAVPAGNVVDVMAQQEAAADHEILQRLVQGVADVDVAVGVGGAVVENVKGRAFGLALLAEGRIEVAPRLDDRGFLLRQSTAHGEGRLGQEDGFAIVATGGRVFAVFGGFGHEVSFRRRWVIVRVGLDIPACTGPWPWALRRAANRNRAKHADGHGGDGLADGVGRTPAGIASPGHWRDSPRLMGGFRCVMS